MKKSISENTCNKVVFKGKWGSECLLFYEKRNLAWIFFRMFSEQSYNRVLYITRDILQKVSENVLVEMKL